MDHRYHCEMSGKSKGYGSKGPEPPPKGRNTGRAKLYLSIRLALIKLIVAQDAAYHGIGRWDIEGPMVESVEALLVAAHARYTRALAKDSDTKPALQEYLKEFGKARKKTNIRKLISLQRHIMCRASCENNAFLICFTSALSLLELVGVTCTDIDCWRSGFKLIGRGDLPGAADCLINTIVFTQKYSQDPLDERNWEGQEYTINTINPMGSQEFKDAQKEKFNSDLFKEREKRAASLPVCIATMAAVYLHILKLMMAVRCSQIDDIRNVARNQKIFRFCQVYLFLALSITSPARASETLCATFDDFTECVEGDDHFMLIFRALMPKGTLPRPKAYEARNWHGKKMKKLIRRLHDVLPLYASALSLPDNLEFCMTIMLRLQPGLLDPEINPQMRLFVGTGNGAVKAATAVTSKRKGRGCALDTESESDTEVSDNDTQKAAPKKQNRKPFGQGDLTTASIDSQLQLILPPGAVRGCWMTGYSCRVSYAVCFDRLLCLDDPRLVAHVCWLYGHEPGSTQAEMYSNTGGRCQKCLKCKGVDWLLNCTCNPKRDRRTRAKLEEAEEEDEEDA